MGQTKISISYSGTHSVRGLPEPHLVPLHVRILEQLGFWFRGSGTDMPISAPNVIPNHKPKLAQTQQQNYTQGHAVLQLFEKHTIDQFYYSTCAMT